MSGLAQNADARHFRRHLLEQLRPLPSQGVLELNEPSDIAARSRETVDVTIADRVQGLCHDDRHRATGLLQCLRGRTNPGQDDLRAERNQLRRVFAQARGIAHAPAIIDPHIAPDGPAQFLEALHERGETGLFPCFQTKG